MMYNDFEVWVRTAAQAREYPVYATNSSSGSASEVARLDVDSWEFKGSCQG
jgi:hypothetical protein